MYLVDRLLSLLNKCNAVGLLAAMLKAMLDFQLKVTLSDNGTLTRRTFPSVLTMIPTMRQFAFSVLAVPVQSALTGSSVKLFLKLLRS